MCLSFWVEERSDGLDNVEYYHAVQVVAIVFQILIRVLTVTPFFRITRTRLYCGYQRDAGFTNRHTGLEKYLGSDYRNPFRKSYFPSRSYHIHVTLNHSNQTTFPECVNFLDGLAIILRTEGNRPWFISSRATANGRVVTTTTQVLTSRGMSSCKCLTRKPVLTPGEYAFLQPQLTFVHATASHPPTAIPMDCVKPWMFEMSYAYSK